MVNVPLKLASFVPEAKPVIPDTAAGADQSYVVPTGTISLVTPSTGVTENASNEHTVAVFAATTGVGFTVTVTPNAVPTQEPLVGVTE